MKKLLFLVPALFSLLACNFALSVGRAATTTPPVMFTPTSQPMNGTITGKLSYPSEFLPPMRVVAFSLTDKKAYFVDTAKGQGRSVR